jgi:hypothetical protein
VEGYGGAREPVNTERPAQRVWVPQTQSTPCDLVILAGGRRSGPPSDTFGSAFLALGTGRRKRIRQDAFSVIGIALFVVRHGCGMPLVGDQDVVEEFAANALQEGFGDCVDPLRLRPQPARG